VQPLVQWKSNKYYILRLCVCSLSYPACSAEAPYCHVACPSPLYFSHYLMNSTIFGEKKVIEHKMCSDFLYNFYLKLFLCCTKKGTRQDHKRLHVKYPLLLSDFNNTSIFFRNIFEKYSNIKFHENPSSGGPSCSMWTDRRTDRHDDNSSCLS
jgi:hypothetical protein